MRRGHAVTAGVCRWCRNACSRGRESGGVCGRDGTDSMPRLPSGPLSRQPLAQQDEHNMAHGPGTAISLLLAPSACEAYRNGESRSNFRHFPPSLHPLAIA